jgi:hypothetical protein
LRLRGAPGCGAVEATLADADKITCAGTMDAYVRGFVDD